MTIKQRIIILALVLITVPVLFYAAASFVSVADGADGKPYSVSLHSPVTFPVDI